MISINRIACRRVVSCQHSRVIPWIGTLSIVAVLLLSFGQAGFAQQIPPCGNGVVDPGEQCDLGPDLNGDCCSVACQFEQPDVSCTGNSQGGVCDQDGSDHCSGVSNECMDVFESAGTICREADGQCDVVELCDGAGGICPQDGFAPAETSCTGSSQGGLCDQDGGDHCSGVSNLCVDVFAPLETICRESNGQCDLAETCDGYQGTCPDDGWLENGMPCDDGLYCNTNEACSAGECGGGIPRDCSFLNNGFQIGACNETTDICEPLPQCIFSDSFESF